MNAVNSPFQLYRILPACGSAQQGDVLSLAHAAGIRKNFFPDLRLSDAAVFIGLPGNVAADNITVIAAGLPRELPPRPAESASDWWNFEPGNPYPTAA